MIRSILVPLDGSTFGEHALPWALSLARRAKARVELLYVHRPLEATYAEMQVFDATLDQQLRDREKAYLEHALESAKAAGVAAISGSTKEGEIAVAIRQHAVETKCDLIVMTTHSRGPMGRFWLGSVSDAMLRDTPTPLLVVHPHDKKPDLREEKVFGRVLVPLDGTPLAEQMLGPAVEFAQLMGAEIQLLRLIKPVAAMTMPVGSASFGEMAHHMLGRIDELQQQLKTDAQNYLDRVAERLRGQGLKVQTQVAIEEQPGVGILDCAKPPVDLIALATHGRRGLSRLFMGSVADKVIRGAHVPVLVHQPVHP